MHWGSLSRTIKRYGDIMGDYWSFLKEDLIKIDIRRCKEQNKSCASMQYENYLLFRW
jgi:hypothetical protein